MDSTALPEKSLPKQKVTQRDVALAANVSQSLVSLILNGAGKEASEEVRQRVLRVARELRYTPLRRRNTGAQRKHFAFLRPKVTRGHHHQEWIYDSYEQFYLDIQEEYRQVLLQEGYNLIVHDHNDSEAAKRWLQKWKVEGVFMDGGSDELVEWVKERYPLVVTRGGGRDIDRVGTDRFERIAIAIDHLYDHGHRRIAFMRLDPNVASNDLAYSEAFRTRCEALGIPTEFIDLTTYEEGAREWARQFAAFKDTGDFPTAIIGAPLHLLILQKEFMRLGIRIPQDLSLIANDNISACRFLEPALTSIDLNFRDIADNAWRVLRARIENPKRAWCRVKVLPRLIPGGSVACPRTAPLLQTGSLP